VTELKINALTVSPYKTIAHNGGIVKTSKKIQKINKNFKKARRS
jgi:hypothetical protein